MFGFFSGRKCERNLENDKDIENIKNNEKAREKTRGLHRMRKDI